MIVIPAQAGIQPVRRKIWHWTPAFAGVTRFFAVLALFGAVVGATLIAIDAQAAPPAPIASPIQHQPLVTPVRVWKDCQAIAMCSGCRPVYRCRSCTYQQTCRARQCSWGDVCVWGPYVKVLPRGARIIR